jgi:acetyltransferase
MRCRVLPSGLTRFKTIQIRPIRPEDEPGIIRFHETLSERTVYQRYLQLLNLNQRTAHDRLIRICFIDYARQIPLVAVRRDQNTGQSDIIGVGRLQGVDTGEGEFAIVISDDCQNLGLGTELLRRMIEIAKSEGVKTIAADILSENVAMQKISKNLGFTLEGEFDEPTVKAKLVVGS